MGGGDFNVIRDPWRQHSLFAGLFHPHEMPAHIPVNQFHQHFTYVANSDVVNHNSDVINHHSTVNTEHNDRHEVHHPYEEDDDNGHYGNFYNTHEEHHVDEHHSEGELGADEHHAEEHHGNKTEHSDEHGGKREPPGNSPVSPPGSVTRKIDSSSNNNKNDADPSKNLDSRKKLFAGQITNISSILQKLSEKIVKKPSENTKVFKSNADENIQQTSQTNLSSKQTANINALLGKLRPKFVAKPEDDKLLNEALKSRTLKSDDIISYPSNSYHNMPIAPLPRGRDHRNKDKDKDKDKDKETGEEPKMASNPPKYLNGYKQEPNVIELPLSPIGPIMGKRSSIPKRQLSNTLDKYSVRVKLPAKFLQNNSKVSGILKAFFGVQRYKLHIHDLLRDNNVPTKKSKTHQIFRRLSVENQRTASPVNHFERLFNRLVMNKLRKKLT